MRVTITIRDVPGGKVTVTSKVTGGKRPNGEGAERLAKSILIGINKAVMASQAIGRPSDVLPVAEAVTE